MGAPKGFRPVKAGQGRPKGSKNKVSKSVRANIEKVFAASGGIKAMTIWAKANPTPFYQIYAKLLPQEHVGEGGSGPVNVKVVHEYITPNP